MGTKVNSEASIEASRETQKQSGLSNRQEDENIRMQMLEAERSDLAGITKQYLDLSTVHGLR